MHVHECALARGRPWAGSRGAERMAEANVAQEIEWGTSLYYDEAAVKVSLQYGLLLLPVKKASCPAIFYQAHPCFLKSESI